MMPMAFSRVIRTTLVLLAFTALAAAQDSVKCESNDGHRRYCGQFGDQVRLERQISGSPCVEGQTWGVDRTGLWVDRGCRAMFTVRGSRQGGGNLPPGGPNSPWWNRDAGDTWPPRGDWHGGNWGSGGACFYTDRGFGGSFFCMRRGEQRDSLAGYGDQISSIRVFGGARVLAFDDRNFGGARATLRRDAPDLGQVPVSQKPGHSWNNRISSIRIQ